MKASQRGAGQRSDAVPPAPSLPFWEKNVLREDEDVVRFVPSHKICARCRRLLPAALFRRNVQMKTLLHSWCRGCVAERNRLWREANPDYVQATNDARREGPFAKSCADCGCSFLAVRRDSTRCPVCQVEHVRVSAAARARRRRSAGSA